VVHKKDVYSWGLCKADILQMGVLGRQIFKLHNNKEFEDAAHLH